FHYLFEAPNVFNLDGGRADENDPWRSFADDDGLDDAVSNEFGKAFTMLGVYLRLQAEIYSRPPFGPPPLAGLPPPWPGPLGRGPGLGGGAAGRRGGANQPRLDGRGAGQGREPDGSGGQDRGGPPRRRLPEPCGRPPEAAAQTPGGGSGRRGSREAGPG